MSGTISFNPYATNQPQSSFLQDTQGYVQGTAFDDPNARLWLMGGQLASTETVTMWGGVPVEELINVVGANAEGLGPVVKRATSQATVTGFSVFNQAGSMVITPGATVPLAAVGNYVSFFRSGTQQRIAVQVDSTITALANATDSIASQALYWDVTNYLVTLTTTGGNFALPTSVKLLSVNTNSKVVNYNSGVVTWKSGAAAIILI